MKFLFVLLTFLFSNLTCFAEAVKGSTCSTGVIDGGPFEKGNIAEAGSLVFINDETRWNICLDGGFRISAPETILFPIDDWDEHTQEEKESETVLPG